MTIRAIKRKALQKQLEALAPQYEAALLQSVTAIDAVAEEKAKQQANAIETRMLSIQGQLDQLDLALPDANFPLDPGRDPNRVDALLQQHLHRVDFKRLRRWLRDLLETDCDAGRAGLVMFRRASEMNGRLAARCIRELLKAETDQGKFRPLPVEIGLGDQNDVGAVLRRLAGHLDLHLADCPAGEQLPLVTATLCRSSQAGSIVFIEIGCCEYLLGDHGAVQWLVTDFWR
ncbi:hypothetical protein [uncultured Thiodictyon sp.]|uniref:hypothetical protein n=1 Tax=uncultured Thiodictyon sp. TaxID=1846217 RepID=UPI0025D17BED|nr:hypothetical protein [uncultured Thiodictyon sp.]